MSIATTHSKFNFDVVSKMMFDQREHENFQATEIGLIKPK